MIELRKVCKDGEPIRAPALGHVTRVEQGGNPELVFCHSEHERAIPETNEYQSLHEYLILSTICMVLY